MTDLNVGKFGKKGVDLSQFNGGLKKENLKTEEQKSIFNAIDADKNGVIDEKEMQDFKSKLDKSEDNHVSRREARKFLKENDLKGLSKKEVLKFLQEYAVNTENVKSAQVVDEDGTKTVHLEYEDGTQEVINPDKSSRVSQTDENGTSTTRYLDADKKLQKDTVSTPEGVTTETEYAEDGETPTIKTVSDSTNGSVSTVVYEEGKPSEKEVKQGSTTSNYTFDEQGNEVLNSKVENQGIPAKEKRTDYTYNEDGTVTANIKQEGTETVQQLKDGKVQSEVIKEAGKTTTIEHAEDGARTETVQDENGNSSVTQFNADGKKLKQTKTINGTTYEVEYDGNGNTKVVLQNGESIEALAKKFGTTKHEIIEANGGKVRGWAGDDLVVPGELDADAKALQNRDSKEVAQAKYRAFAEEVQRQKEEAQAGLEARKGHYFTWVEKKHDTYDKLARALYKKEGNEKPSKYEIQSRIDELKKLNPNVKDGELIGKRIKVSVSEEVAAGISGRQIARERGRQVQKQKQEAKTGSALAKSMHNAIHNHMGGVSEKEFTDALAKVNKDNVLGLVEGYNKLSPDESLLEAIMDETGNTLETRRNAVSKIVNSLVDRAKTSGVTDDRTKQMIDDCTQELESYWSMGIGYCSTEKLDGLVKNVIGAIHVAEAMTNTEKVLASKDNAIDDTLNVMKENVDVNSAKLQKQLDEDGWCADLYEGLKWCVGSDNLDENVKADLKEFENSIAELNAARAQGGDDAFKAKFKEIFGVEYSPSMTQGYRKLQTNLANAQALTLQLDGFNKEFTSSLQGKESYDVMLNKFGSYMQQVSSEVQDGKTVVEQSLTVAMQKDGIDFATASEAQKTQYLQKLIKDTQSGISKQITEYTGGKDLATLEKDLENSTAYIFGNKGDLVNRVNSYISSQQVGGAVVNGAIKAVGAIALAVVTGGTGLVALSAVAVGTAAISATTDLTDRASSNVGLKDGEIATILKNASIDGATVFVGGKITQAAMAFKSSKAFVQAGGRMLAQVAGDVATGAGAEYMQTGEITLQGVTFQAIFSAAGNLVALKQVAKGSHTPSGTTAPKKTLDVATSDGAKMPGGKLGAEKMKQVKSDLADELPGATPERGAQIHQEGDKLQAQSRTQGREVKHMVEDEFGVVTIGKEHIDISTADASTIERLHKEVSGWSTDTRNKAEILKRIEDRMVELHVSPDAPNVTRGSDFVDRINNNAQQNASDILAGKKGALPPHDAAVLKEHLTNNLNTVEDVENFMDALKKRVGVDEKGNMHKYEVQGVDQAADVMKSAEAKLAKMKARQADVAATNSAADAAINGSRGLNEQEFATIKSFVDRTDSVEDLQALINKFDNNKCLRNSQASKKLLKTMKEKAEVLEVKAKTPKVVTPEAQGTTKPQEVYVDPHHIELDRAPSASVPEGQNADFIQVQRRLAAEQASTPVKSNNKVADQKVNSASQEVQPAGKNNDANVIKQNDVAETPVVQSKDNIKTPKVSKESVDADVKSIVDAEIPYSHRKLWADCKQRIADITNELSVAFKGNKAAMVAKCKVLFADLKTISATASASVKTKINNLMKKLRTMIDESGLSSKNVAEPIGSRHYSKSYNSPVEQSQSFNSSHKLGADERVMDGYRDGGRYMKFDNNGQPINKPTREIILVDRNKDAKLQSIIQYVKKKTAKMDEKEKALFLQKYIHEISGGKEIDDTRRSIWKNAHLGKEVLLGDIIAEKPAVAVCRHRSLLYKILGDEVGLNVELQRGNFYFIDDVGGGHAWNTVQFEDGSSIICDAMHNRTSSITPGKVDDYAKKYFTVNDEDLYSKGLSSNLNYNIKDYTNAKVGTALPQGQGVLLSGTERLNLANATLDLNSPQVKSVLDKMKKGDIITVGRNGDIKIKDATRTVSEKHLTIEKTDNGFIVKDTSKNGTSIAANKPGESLHVENGIVVADDGLPLINENELVREVGNNGDPINPKYIKTSREARQYLNDAIESGSYTKSLDSYIETMNDMHVVSAKGKSGNDFWYDEAGKGKIPVNPGIVREQGFMYSPRHRQALGIEDIAKQYGDPYRVPKTPGESIKVRLDGIPDKYLPECRFDVNPGSDELEYFHIYPDGKSLKSYYYKEMYRTSKEALELINNGAPKNQILGKLAEHYQYAANARPYGQINNSLFMNEINTLLSKAGLKTIPHGELDIAAQRLQPNTFKKYFIDQYNKTALDVPNVSAHNGNNLRLANKDDVEIISVEPAKTNDADVVEPVKVSDADIVVEPVRVADADVVVEPVKVSDADVVVEPVKVADADVVVEPVKVSDADMGDTPVLTGKFKNFSNQIDNATTLRQLDEIESSIKFLKDSPEKRALLNKINQKRAEINNNQVIYEAQVEDDFDYQQQQRLQDDLNNQFAAEYWFQNEMENNLLDDMNNGFNGLGGMF